MLDHIDLITRKPVNSTVLDDALIVAIRGGGTPPGVSASEAPAGTYVTPFAGLTASQTVLPYRTNRASCLLFNDTDAVCFVRLGNLPCTPADFSVRIPIGGVLTMTLGDYNGAVTVCWAAPAAGSLRVTEVL
jgi:hypothetical protein